MSSTCRTHGENKNEYEVLDREAEVKRPPACSKSRYMITLRLITLKYSVGVKSYVYLTEVRVLQRNFLITRM
jgi:hypothetical protein